jgi:formiminotetrahydrofolate cyclodeaminase
MFKMLAPVVSNVAPMAGMGGGVAGSIAGSMASTAVSSAANMSAATKSKDQFTFDYSLVSTGDNSVKAGNSVKAKAKSDGEDVLTPMVEAMAEAVSKAEQ